MEIIGEKVVLRPYTLERCHEFFKEYIADSVMTYDRYVYHEEKVNHYYRDKVMDDSRRYFAVCINARVIGEIQIKNIHFERSCGTLSVVLIDDSVKGKGFGTEAQRLILDFAVNVLGLRTIYADVIHRNQRSKHVLDKIGFRHLYDDEDLAYYEYTAE